jgi:hypothetical protein
VQQNAREILLKYYFCQTFANLLAGSDGNQVGA